MITLATDVDNTLVDTSSLLNKELFSLFPDIDPNDPDILEDYDKEAYGISSEDLVDIIATIVKRGDLDKVKPIRNASTFLNSFVDAGNKVVYISTRAPYYYSAAEAKEALRIWLEKNNFPAGQIHITQTDDEKVAKAMAVGADGIIDDLPKVAMKVLDTTDVKPFMYNQPWNAKFNHPKVNKFSNWNLFGDLIYAEFGIIV